MGSNCGYCKLRHEARQRKRRSSEAVISGCQCAYTRLSKPPKVQSPQEKPRNRLQKRAFPSPHTPTLVTLYVLAYEPYPYNTRPSEFLGVYSTLNSVTSGALRHGAYSFSREGLLDGNEYLSPTGRIKIIPETLQQAGVAVNMASQIQTLTSEHIRLDIPHPEHQNQVEPRQNAGETVYLAVHQEPQAAVCIGVFAKKSLAWGACLKDKASFGLTATLYQETSGVCLEDLPRITARVSESGWHSWFVALYTIDA